MSSRGKSWSEAKAACPRPEHVGSRVRFDGQYGAPGHRRQYYKCVPANGDRPHRFTEVLPREESWKDACEVCERDVEFNEGPHAARKYQFVARGVAGALVAVGAGSTYRAAAGVARERARRLRVDPQTGELRFSRHVVAGDGLGGGVRAGRVRGASPARVASERVAVARRLAVQGARPGQRPAPDRVPGVRRDGV
jgi:hypothetical protein